MSYLMILFETILQDLRYGARTLLRHAGFTTVSIFALAVGIGVNPIDRSLRLGTDGHFHNKGELLPDGSTWQIIGVARDTRGVTLDRSDSQQVYLPCPQTGSTIIQFSSGQIRIRR